MSSLQRITRNNYQKSIVELLGDSDDTLTKFVQKDTPVDIAQMSKYTITVPEHQRYYEWDNLRQEKLIDSIMQNYPIPSIIIKEGQYVEEGQQRLTCIQKYILDEFAWNGKLYSELTRAELRYFQTYTFSICDISNCSRDQESDIYERLNSGKKLTDNKLFWSRKDTPIIRFIMEELPKIPQFAKYIGIPGKRNGKSKTFPLLEDMSGAVIALKTGDISMLTTAYRILGSELHNDFTNIGDETKIIQVFKDYIRFINEERGGLKGSKYKKLSGMLGLYICAVINKQDEKMIRWYISIYSEEVMREILKNVKNGNARNFKKNDWETRYQALLNHYQTVCQ